MATLIVDGPTPQQGEIEVAGAKSSMSKLLTVEPCEFANVPAIGDTEITKATSEGLAPDLGACRLRHRHHGLWPRCPRRSRCKTGYR
ncbi:MAG TPA: hypothetical protein EYQ18_12020 [Candidatus Handelsmanbacteria bacterium]|nr:hypothetical protein [Candidatus Handelsmanbacteria bacterium]